MRKARVLGWILSLALLLPVCMALARGPEPIAAPGSASAVGEMPTRLASEMQGRCGDGPCDGPEDAQCSPQDCAPPMTPPALPLFVLIWYHVEPNPQLFEAIEPGYFEGISRSMRQMSQALRAIKVPATFCVSWLYNDLVYCRNHDSQTGQIVNRPRDTGIETFGQLVGDGHEIAYHTHPPNSIKDGQTAYYVRPNSACTGYDMDNLHRWAGLGAGHSLDFEPGVYQFDDPADPWYGQFIWERTSETLFALADYLGVTVRHTNGGQKPLLDLTNEYGYGISHPHCIQQLRSLMASGFDLIAPESMAPFSPQYTAQATPWRDPSTGHAAYFGPQHNVQVYYPDIDSARIDRAAALRQGLTLMPVPMQGSMGWIGAKDARYYDPGPKGGTAYGGIHWHKESFYGASREREIRSPWSMEPITVMIPSMAERFNNSLHRHLTETPHSVNAWSFGHHIVNVLWSDFSGVSDNWDLAVSFILDIADGQADQVINAPRPDLVRFVTFQQLAEIYDSVNTHQVYLPVAHGAWE
jgi:hypothetical protein